MQEPVRPNLAISLHAPNARAAPRADADRGQVRAAGRDRGRAALPDPRGGVVTYEYVMLRGVNDQPQHARDLVRLLKGAPRQGEPHPAQPGARDPVRRARPPTVDAFCRILADARVTVSVRRPRGQDILAACGQLHLQERARPAVSIPVLSALPSDRAWPVRVALFLAAAAVLLFWGLGQAPLERAEIYFLDGARSMLERHDLLVPYYRGQPFFDKPPLTYWLMAASFHAFGIGAGAARVVPAVAALSVLMATLWLGSVLFDRRTAWAAALMLATTGAFLGFGRVAMSDMLLAL